MKTDKLTKAVRKSPTFKVTALLPDSLRPYLDEVQSIIARRAFELFETGGCRHGHDHEHWFDAEKELLSPAPSYLTESGDALNLRITIEGFKKTEFKVSVESRRVVLVGKRQRSASAKKRSAISHPELILSVVNLPVEISPKKTVIQFRTGMLTFELPRSKGNSSSARTQAA